MELTCKLEGEQSDKHVRDIFAEALAAMDEPQGGFIFNPNIVVTNGDSGLQNIETAAQMVQGMVLPLDGNALNRVQPTFQEVLMAAIAQNYRTALVLRTLHSMEMARSEDETDHHKKL